MCSKPNIPKPMSTANDNKKAATNTSAPSKHDSKDQRSGSTKGMKEQDDMKKDRSSTSTTPTGKTDKNAETRNK